MMRILLVDDDSDVRAVLVAALQSFATVIEAECGAHGVEVFEQVAPVNIILTDWFMPIDGVEMLRRIKMLANPQPPAVLITGHDPSLITLKCRDLEELKVVDIWQKPIKFLGLEARLNLLLKHGASAYCYASNFTGG